MNTHPTPPCPTSQERLEYAMALAHRTARLWPLSSGAAGVDADDLLQEARIAAWRALEKFREGAGMSLKSWIVLHCRGAIRERFRRADFLSRAERNGHRRMLETDPAARPPRQILSLEHLLSGMPEESPGRLAERLGRVDRNLEAVEDRMVLEAAFAALRGRVSRAAEAVARWYYLEHHGLSQCARRLHVCEARGWQYLHAARRVLRAVLRDEPLPRRRRRRPGRWRSEFLRALEDGATVSAAALRADVAPSTPYTTRRSDGAFDRAWREIDRRRRMREDRG